MKKSLFIAIGMACVLFFYGYISLNAGHNHGQHDTQQSHTEEHHH